MPGAPGYLAAERIAPPKAGEAWPVVAKRYEQGLKRANIKIEAARRDWRQMKAALGGAR